MGTDTSRFNRKHKLFGHLFNVRSKALVVDGSGSSYSRTVCEYVRPYSVLADLIAAEEPLNAYRWNSNGEYLKGPRRRMARLRVNRVFLGRWGSGETAPKEEGNFVPAWRSGVDWNKSPKRGGL